jgi:hypothetical protein
MQFQTTQYDFADFQSLGKVTIVTKAHRSPHDGSRKCAFSVS